MAVAWPRPPIHGQGGALAAWSGIQEYGVKFMGNAKLTRREREKLDHRREVLAGALQLFSEHGFHNVSTQQVAEKSNFSIGSLYNYFKNKEDIYRTLLDELANTFHEAVAEALAEGHDEVEKLRRYVKTMGSVFGENLVFIRLYHRETAGVSANPNAGFDDTIRVRHAEFLQVLSGIMADGMESGAFRRIAEPCLLAVALDGIVSAMMLPSLEDPENMTIPEDPNVPLNILFQGLLVS